MLAELPHRVRCRLQEKQQGLQGNLERLQTPSRRRLRPNPGLLRATSASIHDSQVAIPLMTMTSARIAYLYDVMDAAYDAAEIRDHGKALGHTPIIHRNFRAQHEAKAEWAREGERMKLIHMPDPDDIIFDLRTIAERINARLKDEFGARFVRLRGAIKVTHHRRGRAAPHDL
jgi:hypothetical protein